MIKFLNLNENIPFQKFKELYDKAVSYDQKIPYAISISSLNKDKKEVDSRFVNLKIVDGEDFIFFSNYNSPKSIQFKSHDQIAALIFWDELNIQVRIKAKIKKTEREFNKLYFEARSKYKNALAISSNQSEDIRSYEDVSKNFNNALEKSDLYYCPDYWGGFKFTPYQFEFWYGHDNRVNKRELYIKKGTKWQKKILQP